MDEIYPKYTAPKFINYLSFELNGWVGRKLFKNTSIFKPLQTPFLIDIGVGPDYNYKDGWLHVDYFRYRIKKFWKYNQKRKRPDVETDLRYPLKCPSNIADGVYSCHTLEHLFPEHAYNLLGEIFRILKPGCWLRISVPDLKKVIDYYNGEIVIPEYNYKFKAEAFGHLTQNHGHHSVWDAELLINALKIKGFINISEVEFGKVGTDTRLIKENDERKYETLVIEAQKPIL